jgi:hypothetical protein
MMLILLLLVLVSGGATYYAYRNNASKYARLVPAMLTILMIYLLFGKHMH